MRNLITVLISTSPITSHPSTAIIEKAIASVRHHLPDVQIFIMVDGVRKEQAHFTERYVEYIHQLIGHGLLNERNVVMLPFMEFHHQAAMTRRALEMVETPLIIFVEHDTFFIPDFIDFKGIARLIVDGEANVVNFHSQPEPWILPEHEHLMIDKERVIIATVPILRTWQWSQRPHVASANFYRKMLKAYFTPDCRTMIEDRMHDLILSHRAAFGDANWDQWRLMIYAPEGSIRRTDTLNGRGDERKFEMIF